MGFAYLLSQNVQVQGSLATSYLVLSSNIRLQYLGEIIGGAGPENFSMQNMAELNDANLTCTRSSCTIKMPYGYYLISK